MEDALEAIIDYRGKTPKKSEKGIPTLSAKSVKNNHIDYDSCYYISSDEYKRFMVRGLPQIGDVLLTTEAPLGMVAQLDRNDVGIAQRLLTLRGKQGILDNEYLLYYLQSPIGQALLRARETGTTVTGIKQSEFRKIQIYIPDIENQRKIGGILRGLDDKIAVNNSINKNLEQQLSEIYNDWYGKFKGSQNSRKTANDFGDIPAGWHYCQVGDLCKSISITHKFDKDELIFLNTGDIENGQILRNNYMNVKSMPGQAKKTIAQNDILYSEIRPINKHFAYVNFQTQDYVVSTKLMVIRTNNFDSRRLYHYLTLAATLNDLQTQAESRSGTFPQITFENISKLPILIADEKTETAFTTLLHSAYAQIDKNNLENNQLGKIRDALLPKLMSGELDVSDIDL